MLRTYLVLAQVCVLSGTIGAQQLQSSGTPTEAEKSGRKIFQTRCAMCHVGQDPAVELGNDSAPRRQTTFGPLLSKALTVDAAALREKIKNGGPRMPGYKLTLTDEQVDQVIGFMKTFERPLTKLALVRAGE